MSYLTCLATILCLCVVCRTLHPSIKVLSQLVVLNVSRQKQLFIDVVIPPVRYPVFIRNHDYYFHTKDLTFNLILYQVKYEIIWIFSLSGQI